MKRAALVALITVALGLSTLAAENNETLNSAAPADQPGTAAMRRAAEANQYLFAFFYEKDDEATRSARRAFESASKKITPAPQVIAVDRTASGEKAIVEKFGMAGAPMPMVLAIAPNGAVTGAIKGTEIAESRLQEAIATPGMQQCLKALQEQKWCLCACRMPGPSPMMTLLKV